MVEWHQRGHVLWAMLMLLGLLAELASSSLQLAARNSAQAHAELGQQGRDARAEAIAQALEALPVPSARPLAAEQLPLWHPASLAGDGAAQGCGNGGHASYVTACIWPVAGDLLSATQAGEGWHWQLLRLPDALADDAGTDYTAFPLLRPQHWRLQVVVTGRAGRRASWRYDYLQQAAP